MQASDIDAMRASAAELETKLVTARQLFEDGEISTATFVNIDTELRSQIESARQALAQAGAEFRPLP